MVVDTKYYDALQISANATQLEIKKSYRKLAIKLHPDKNPNDPTAASRFQEIGEAYQVLSDVNLRNKYDLYGVEGSKPQEGFEDPSEFFSMIFGGEAFKEWIGELTLLSDLGKSMEMSEAGKEKEDDETTADVSGATDDMSKLYISQHDVSEEEKKKEVEKRKKEEVEKFEEESRLKKLESYNQLAANLVNKLSLWTETDQKQDITESFLSKLRYETEILKMESFGIEILHTIGKIYLNKAKIFLKNQTFLGWGGIWYSMKDKGDVVYDTFKTIKTALDAQSTMSEYTKMQEDNEYHLNKEGEPSEETETHETTDNKQDVTEDAKEKEKEKEIPFHTPEDLAEMEKLLMGKVLSAAWLGSKYEIQTTARSVVDLILQDKGESLNKRIDRAKALTMVGEVFINAQRTKVEEEEAQIFEEIVAESQKKREKKK